MKKLVLIFLVLVFAQTVEATIHPSADFSPEDAEWSFNFTEVQEGEVYCNTTHCEFRNTGLEKSDFVVGRSGDIDIEGKLALTKFSQTLIEFRAYGKTSYRFKVLGSATFDVYRDGDLQRSIDSGPNGLMDLEGGEGRYRVVINDPEDSSDKSSEPTTLNGGGGGGGGFVPSTPTPTPTTTTSESISVPSMSPTPELKVEKNETSNQQVPTPNPTPTLSRVLSGPQITFFGAILAISLAVISYILLRRS